MNQEQDTGKKTAADSFGDMIRAFGEAVGEVFDDPALKEKVREFADSASQSARTFGNRFKDEEVRAKFQDLGKAAQSYGRSLA
ncbi:N-acetyltransferase, partial [Chloroflexota bacterium]